MDGFKIVIESPNHLQPPTAFDVGPRLARQDESRSESLDVHPSCSYLMEVVDVIIRNWATYSTARVAAIA